MLLYSYHTHLETCEKHVQGVASSCKLCHSIDQAIMSGTENL